MVIYLVLIGTVLLSGSLVFVIPRSEDKKVLRFLLAFSGAFLIGLTFLKLVPEIFSQPAPFTGLFVLAGFLIQLVLELITEGAEHGHPHNIRKEEKVSPFLLLTGLCIHSFLEGMPIVAAFETGIQHTLVIGIVVHNIPISLTLMSLFLHYNAPRGRPLRILVIFALMTPLGSAFSRLLQFIDPHSLSASIISWPGGRHLPSCLHFHSFRN